MCGITACVAKADVLEPLQKGLENLEYRGYDSSGIAVNERDGGITVLKQAGNLEDLIAAADGADLSSNTGIAHTRWSTHGPPTDANAHPHTDCTGTVAVVHNGIIENYDGLRTDLREQGHQFTSQTDTEVIPHLIEAELSTGTEPRIAFRRAIAQLEGSFAVAAIVEGDGSVYAARQGSPLVLGLDENRRFLASDVPSFLEYTDEVVYLEDGDFVEINRIGYRITDADGNVLERTPEHVDWQAEDATRDGFSHYMLKEIHEQPTALSQTIKGRVDESGTVTLEDFPPGTFADVDDVHFVACGTSYHAALYARRLLVDDGISAYVHRAGEYATSPHPVSPDSLVIAVTQSGETADTLQTIRAAREAGARTLAVTNVVGSTAARECDDALFIRAGPEIGVAATKTFSSQVATLSLLRERLFEDMTGSPRDGAAASSAALLSLPEDVATVVDRAEEVSSLVDRFRDRDGYFFIGRGTAHPVALEGALKFKEITYEHAEGFSASQLKHGPLALVTENTPVIAVFDGQNDTKTLANVEEVRARDAPIIGVGPAGATGIRDRVDEYLSIPDTHPDFQGVLANVQLQFVSYHMADQLGRAIDKPRNLAKSVTVE